MTIGWPAAFVLVALILGGVSLYATVLASRGAVATEETKGKYTEQYQILTDDYAKLAQETREQQASIRADVDRLAKEIRETQASVGADVNRLANSVEAIEQMMRDVG